MALAWPAPAHVVLGTPTLQLRTLQSDLVARVRIVDPAVLLELQDPPLRETVVVAEVLELLKGASNEKQLRFVQHGHGVVEYAAGDEVLLFVDRISKSPELGKSRIASRIDWVSEQESGEKFSVDDATREDFGAAVRAYASLPGLTAQQRPEAVRSLTLKLLASPNDVLASSALRDVVMASRADFFTAADLPALDAIQRSPDTKVGIRIGLLAELERSGLVDAPARWVELLRTTRGPERLAVVRAVAAHPSAEVARELASLLASDDVDLVATTAVSFGSQRSDVAVEPLAGLLGSAEARVRQAAIRGLGRLGSPAATAALARAAATHPDSATRRRAAAELKVLARSATPRPSPAEDPPPLRAD